MNHPSSKPIRWWPAFAILSAAAVALAFLWIPDASNRQTVVFGSFATMVLCVLLLMFWFFAFSLIPGRLRVATAIAIIGVGISLAASVRIKGVSGDFVPILAWRWSEEAVGGLANGARDADRDPIADYPQFLGPTRNATLSGLALSDWKIRPPNKIWRRPVGAGWSSFAIVATHAVTQEQRGNLECVVSYNLLTGEEQWVHADEARFNSTIAGDGPRATPTIHKGRVYTYGALGQLNCLDLETGRKIWSRRPLSENGAEPPMWGNSCSPLIDDGAVIVSAGGQDKALIAYEAETGEVRWSGGSSKAGYSSPTVAHLVGRKQILIFNSGQLAAHDADNGQPLWAQPWAGVTECTSQPMVLPGDRVFLSSGYGIGSKLFQISAAEEGPAASVVWESPRLKTKFTNAVFHAGSIYGLDDGVLVCLDPETGQRRWKRGRYGHGQILLIGNHILIQTESGELAVVAADPTEFREIARHPALDGKTWNNPVFAPPYLLVRNDQEAICFELGLEDVASLTPGSKIHTAENPH